MTIADADYWMVRRDTDRCVLLSHERGVIVATRLEEATGEGEQWELLVRLDGDEIHDEVHAVADTDELWAEIESFGERFQDE
jgi:hypothetical protein